MKALHILAILTIALLTTTGCKKEMGQASDSPQAVTPVNEQQVRQDIQKALLEIQKVQGVDMSVQLRVVAQFVVVPAGSVDALAQALQDAGEGGIVYLRSGLHTETAGVVISKKVILIGENGAVLKVKSVASVMNLANGVSQINPAIHVLNAPQTGIQNIEIQPMDTDGSTAILYENSPLSAAMYCTFKSFIFSVLVEKSNQMTIMGNKITASTLWQANPGPNIGILVSNGKSAWIANNEVQSANAGIFMSDQYGSTVNNNTHNNYWGIVLCHIAPNSLKMPDGHLTGAQSSANNWKVRGNKADNNINIGYVVIDGSNDNTLDGNTGTGNGAYDIELVGQTSRIGFPMPPCFNNRVTAAAGQSVKDCGNNNTVSGGNRSTDGCSDPVPNDVAVAWVQLQQKLFITTAGFGNGVVTRVFGYTGIAMYEALLPSLNNYRSLAQQIGLTGLPTVQSNATYNGPLSINAAMATICRSFFPTTSAANKATIDSLEAAYVARYSGVNAADAQRSVDFGKQVANVIFEWSKTDGALATNPPYVPPVGAGLWVPTPPAFGNAIAPYSGSNRTFISGLVNSVTVIPPVAYSESPTSDYYKMAKEIYDISQNLTAEQTTIAKTWADVAGGYNASNHYINIMTQLIANNHLPLDDAAVLYAKSGIAISDVGTVIFKVKYQYNGMRPITYIRSVMGQPTWNTLVPTPAHPEYLSGLPITGQALMEVLKNRFGNNTPLVDRTNEALYGARSFTTLDALLQEATNSRLYAGIHYRGPAETGTAPGVQVGRRVNQLVFKQ
jgi:Periplasmic copper-binding protein (NosD)